METLQVSQTTVLALPERASIENETFDEERALYNITTADVIGCTFAGSADGESVLKEVRDVNVVSCKFSLRYPLWHAQTFSMTDSEMDLLARAPVWYSQNGRIDGCQITGTKFLRECQNIHLVDSTVQSTEFGWKCTDLTIVDTGIESEYVLFDSTNLKIDRLKMSGKYSFQYVEQTHINNSVLDTKDAFWHSKNVTVENSIVKGEYLGWFSENLTLVNCTIIGTQPLCYCKNLRLVNCTMQDTTWLLSIQKSMQRSKGMSSPSKTQNLAALSSIASAKSFETMRSWNQIAK